MPKPRTTPLTKIDVSLFTPLMINQLKIGLERYLYLKNEFPSFKTRIYNSNDDFVFEYSDYYALRAALKDFSKPIVKETYFKLLKTTSTTDPLRMIGEFKRALPAGVCIGDHLSFCSKLCHTVDNNVPIYDSRIKQYLVTIYKIKGDYPSINNWYHSPDPVASTDQTAMLSWFRRLPEFVIFSSISDVKVIDAIIFTWHKYH